MWNLLKSNKPNREQLGDNKEDEKKENLEDF